MVKRNLIKYSLVVLTIGILLISDVIAQEMPVSPSLQGELIPKILILNKNFNSNEEIKVGIVYSKYLKSSIEAYNEIAAQLNNSSLSVKFKVIALDISDLKNIRNDFLSLKLNSIYIAPVRGYNYSLISNACKDLQILSISGVPELSSHFSVSFDVVDKKIRILLNMNSVKSEGINFSSKLLKIAKMIN